MQENNSRGKPNREVVDSKASIEIYDRSRLQTEMALLLPQLAEVTTNALGKTPDDMREVASSFNFLLAIKENGKIVGYGGYEIEKNVPGVGTILDESKMIRRDMQGKGYGALITQKVIELHPEADCLVFTSQNPRQIQSARRALQGRRLAPIDVSYQENEQFQGLLRNIVANTGREDINPDTGIRRNMYFGERFGDYEFDLSDPDIAFIEQRLSATGFNRDAGDGVFFIAKLTSSPYETLSQSLDSIAQDTTRTAIVEGEEIVHAVMGTVGKAISEIKMTMDLAEEISQPLPEAYHQLLLAKLDDGVQISRVGFGTKEDFQMISQLHGFNSPNFKFAHNPNLQEYQRMILVDNNTLFFRHNNVFHRTTDVELIAKFQSYLSKTLRRSLGENSPQ